MVLKDRSHYLGIKTADFKSPFRCLEKEKAGVGAHTFNPSAWEAEAGGSQNFKTSPRLGSECLIRLLCLWRGDPASNTKPKEA